MSRTIHRFINELPVEKPLVQL